MPQQQLINLAHVITVQAGVTGALLNHEAITSILPIKSRGNIFAELMTSF